MIRDVFKASLIKFGLFVLGLFLVLGQINYARADDTVPPAMVTVPPEVTIVVPMTFMEGDLVAWDQIDEGLRESPVSVINLEIQGFGGAVFAENKFIAALKYAQAHGKTINMIVVGPSYSAHALITCYANTVVIRPEGALMFHQMKADSGMLGIDLETVPTDASALSMQAAEYAECVKNGRLTQQDVDAVMSDHEVTFTHNEKGQLVKSYYGNSQGLLLTVAEIARLVAVISIILAVLQLIRRAIHIRKNDDA